MKHDYLKSLRGEQLTLKVMKDLPLVAKDGKDIVLRANSSFVFDVDEVATKQRGDSY